MLRCRILSCPAWKFGGSSLHCFQQAKFSNLPSSRLPSPHDDGTHISHSRSILSPDVLIGTELPPGTLREPLAENQPSSEPFNDIHTSTSRTKPQLEESKSVAESGEAADVTEETRDHTKILAGLKSAENLLQKLIVLRSASRDILTVATSAIKLAEKVSQRKSSISANGQQDSVGDLLSEEKGNLTSSITSSPKKKIPRNRTAARRRNRNARDGAVVVARRVACDPPNTLVRRTKSTSQKEQPRPKVENIITENAPEKVEISYKKVPKSSIPKSSAKDVKSALLSARQLKVETLDVPEQPPVKTLSYDLDRVLFKQGVYNLQDPRTGVFNFDHYLQNIMPAEEFDFDSLASFISSSQDNTLQNLAKENGKRYVGSTSSMTSVLSHFHFLLSNFRPIGLGRISRAYPKPLSTFTEFTRIPASIFLKYADGVYAVDSDKEFDRATILSRLGQSLEKLLTVPRDRYEQYRKTSSEKISEEIKNTPEAYHYSSLANFVFRSQLDGRHEWLPGTGVFDIKTRACVTIRMDQDHYKEMSGYQIRDLYGEWESYEREYLDMLRSTMLKYSLQVRMGRMDGIFVAYHNTEQIFGFQYVPLSEMDLAIHGQENLALGDQEFKFSMQMFSDVLDLVTEQFPRQSIRFHFETRPRSNGPPEMYIFAEPMDAETMDTVQQAETEIAIQEFRDEMMGKGSSAQVNGASEEISMEFEDQHEQDLSRETGIFHESGSDLSSEWLQESNTSSIEAEPQDVVLNLPTDELILVEEAETAAGAAAQPTDAILDPINSDEHNEFQSETISNNESPLSSANGEDVAEVSPVNQETEDNRDSLVAETGFEHSPQAGSILNGGASKENQSGRRPVLGFSLSASHFIDGSVVQVVPSINYTGEWPIQQAQYRKGKPVNAPPLDKTWNVSYKIRQFTDDEARKLYSACQARKRKKFEQLDQRDDYRDKYIRTMKAWSQRGRSHRNKAEKAFSKDIKQVAP